MMMMNGDDVQVTICQRTMHYTYMKPKSSYAFGFGFGTVLPVTCLSILSFYDLWSNTIIPNLYFMGHMSIIKALIRTGAG